MDAETREQLLAEFARYLDAPVNQPSTSVEPDQTPAVDLFAVFTELAALRNEARLQSRQFKSALEQLREALTTLEADNGTLSRELQQLRAAAAKAARDAQRPLLLDVLDLRDRMEAGVSAARAYRPGRLRSLFAGEHSFIGAMVEGMEITLRRLDEMLARHEVAPIAAVGKRLDPHTMRAAAVESRPEKPNGIVLREIRRGFVRGAEKLREAEVIVNKVESNA
jgi:molecular chaperone GrpE